MSLHTSFFVKGICAVRKIIILGNSGSGKTTLAKRLQARDNLAHLDLDSVAWKETDPTERLPLRESWQRIVEFIGLNDGWVIEGCYTDLLEKVAPLSNELIFLNLPVGACIENARNRPWESHKYPSKQAQDKNLEMLIDWIRAYQNRTDHCSYTSHNKLYSNYVGVKKMITENDGSA